MRVKVKLRKWINRAELFLSFLWISAKLPFMSMSDTEKKILFTFNDHKLFEGFDGGNGRYVYLIIKRFVDAGYGVYFHKRLDYRTYCGLGKHGRLVLTLKNVKVTGKAPENAGELIYAFDSIDKDMMGRTWKQLVFVNTFKPSYCRVGHVLWIPYFMHAVNYLSGQDKLVGLHRTDRRRIKMVFSGNTDKRYYRNPRITKVYGQMTRLEGMNALLEIGEQVKSGDGKEALTQILNNQGYRNECRILLTNEKFPVKPREWFRLLSSSDFFVCLSGTDLPMCHNVIEAMAVGTIPIIQYTDWFFPSLEHNKNAVVYSGKEDLKQKIRDVLNMPEDRIRELRKNVIQYYERHLTAEKFIQKFEAQNSKIFTIMLHPRLICKPDVEELGRTLDSDLRSCFGPGSKPENNNGVVVEGVQN